MATVTIGPDGNLQKVVDEPEMLLDIAAFEKAVTYFDAVGAHVGRRRQLMETIRAYLRHAPTRNKPAAAAVPAPSIFNDHPLPWRPVRSHATVAAVHDANGDYVCRADGTGILEFLNDSVPKPFVPGWYRVKNKLGDWIVAQLPNESVRDNVLNLGCTIGDKVEF